MEVKTTEFAKEMLAFAKKLLKELDAAWFLYDRERIVTLLSALATAHKNSEVEATVQYLEQILRTLETVEDAYDTWAMNQEIALFLGDTKQKLYSFSETLPRTQTPHHVLETILTAIKQIWWRVFFGVCAWLEVCLLIVVLALWVLVVVVDTEGGAYLRYMVILSSLMGVAVLLLNWMAKLESRVVALMIICAGVWTWASIL